MLVNAKKKETSHVLKMPLQAKEETWELYHYPAVILRGYNNAGVKGKQKSVIRQHQLEAFLGERKSTLLTGKQLQLFNLRTQIKNG